MRPVAAEARLPDAVGQDHVLVGVRLRLVLGEAAAEERLAPERGEERRRDRERPQLLRLAALGQVDAAAGEQRRVLDRGRLGLAIEVVGNRDAGLRQPHQRIGVPDEDQPVGVRIRQRPQERLVEQAEDRGVGADPERQGQDRDQGEDRLLAKRAEGVADVLHGCLDGKEPYLGFLSF